LTTELINYIFQITTDLLFERQNYKPSVYKTLKS